MTKVIKVAAVVLMLVGSTAGAAPKVRQYVPTKPFHVCVQFPDGSEDRWTFQTSEAITDPIPSPALARSIRNAVYYSGQRRNDTDLMLAAAGIVYTEPMRYPNRPWGMRQQKEDPPAPGVTTCICATAVFSDDKRFLGCVTDGCDGCQVCRAR